MGKDEGCRDVWRNNCPDGYQNLAGNTPIGLLVDDYEMANGDPFDWGSNAHKYNPYKNRDPRFYATILYDGADWKQRDLASGDVDPASQIQTCDHDLIGSNGKVSHRGLDTRFSAIEDRNGSWTGCYTSKII